MPYFVKEFIYVKKDRSNFIEVVKARIYFMCVG